jgi:hypothetical protein
MKFLAILAILTVGLVSACSYRHETVAAAPPAATVVATPAPSGTVIYTDPAPVTTTTVYTTR